MVRLSAQPGDQRVQRGGGQRRRAAHADPHVHAYGQPDRHGDGNTYRDCDRDANRYRDTDRDGNAQPNANRYRDAHRHMDAHGNSQRYAVPAVAAVDPALRYDRTAFLTTLSAVAAFILLAPTP